jgi:hypothetical protein
MAAALVDRFEVLMGEPIVMSRVQLSSLTSAQAEDVLHGGPSGASPFAVILETVAAATSGTVSMERAIVSDSTANNTCRLVFTVSGGGNIANAVVRATFLFLPQASGGTA